MTAPSVMGVDGSKADGENKHLLPAKHLELDGGSMNNPAGSKASIGTAHGLWTKAAHHAFVLPGRWVWASGAACGAICQFIFSIAALAVKLMDGRVPLLEFTAHRALMSWVLTIFVAWRIGLTPMHGHVKNLPRLIIRGTMQAMGMVTYYAAMYLLPLADTVVIGLLHPPMTALISRIVLKEPMGWRGWTGCTLSLLGVVVLAHPPYLTHLVDHIRGTGAAAHMECSTTTSNTTGPLNDTSSSFAFSHLNQNVSNWGSLNGTIPQLAALLPAPPPVPSAPPAGAQPCEEAHDHSTRLLGVCLGLFSAMMQACTNVYYKFICDLEPAMVLSVWFHIITLMFSIIPAAVGWPDKPVMPTLEDHMLLLTVAACSFSGHLLMSRAFQLLPAATTAMFAFTVVAWAYLYEITIFHDPITIFGVAGTILVSAGVGLVISRNYTSQGRKAAQVAAAAASKRRQAAGIEEHTHQGDQAGPSRSSSECDSSFSGESDEFDQGDGPLLPMHARSDGVGTEAAQGTDPAAAHEHKLRRHHHQNKHSPHRASPAGTLVGESSSPAKWDWSKWSGWSLSIRPSPSLNRMAAQVVQELEGEGLRHAPSSGLSKDVGSSSADMYALLRAASNNVGGRGAGPVGHPGQVQGEVETQRQASAALQRAGGSSTANDAGNGAISAFQDSNEGWEGQGQAGNGDAGDGAAAAEQLSLLGRSDGYQPMRVSSMIGWMLRPQSSQADGDNKH